MMSEDNCWKNAGMVQPSAMPMTPPESGIESLKFLIGYTIMAQFHPVVKRIAGNFFCIRGSDLTLRKELLPKFLIRCELTTETNNPASERAFIIGLWYLSVYSITILVLPTNERR